MSAAVVDLTQIIESDIPEGRRNLKDSYANLERVASYCESSYLQSPHPDQVLNETKNYTTQSLASVAYQINTLATNFLHLLDLHSTQLSDMESSVNHLSQTVMIHKEKVARREIGVLTTNKSTTRPQNVKNPGIIFPEQPERPIKYVRRPIDYSTLDAIGHGVKSHQQSSSGQRGARRTSSTSSKSGSVNSASQNGSTGGYAPGMGSSMAPTTRPPSPPSGMRGSQQGNSLQRQTSSPYRRPAPPVSPPSIPPTGPPSHYSTNQNNSRTQKMTYASLSEQQQQQQRMSEQQRLSQIQQSKLSRQDSSGYGQQQQVKLPYQMSAGSGPPTGTVHPIQSQSQPKPQSPPSPSPPPPPMPPGLGGGQEFYGGISEVPPTPPPPPLEPDSPLPPAPPNESMYAPLSPTEMSPLPPPPESAYQSPSNIQVEECPSALPPPPLQQAEGGYSQNFHIPNPQTGYRLEVTGGYDPGQYHGGHNAPLQQERDIPDWVPTSYIEKVVAIYDYSKDKEDELTFNEGALIYVIKKNDDGWWEGVMGGTTGLFPGNYVEPCI